MLASVLHSLVAVAALAAEPWETVDDFELVPVCTGRPPRARHWAHYRGFATDASGRLYVCGNGRLAGRPPRTSVESCAQAHPKSAGSSRLARGLLR
jgi:hypothetical protein